MEKNASIDCLTAWQDENDAHSEQIGGTQQSIHAWTDTVLALIREKMGFPGSGKETVLVAIDGRCAAGKTTLANALGKRRDCPKVCVNLQCGV